MTSAPPYVRRLLPLGCLLAAALTLSACGGDGAATAESTAVSRPVKVKPAVAAKPCPTTVGAFVRSLDRLRGQLAVGLSYEQYAARIRGLEASYGAIPVSHLAIDCLTTVGAPAEQALNKYIDAANAWGECLADASCSTASIEPVLQRRWRIASGDLSKAR
jgi:hypothetical protein